MAIALEAFTVVVKIAALDAVGGLDGFRQLVPNQTFCHDDELARCGYLDRAHAVSFIEQLTERGLSAADPVDSDIELVNAFDGTVVPNSGWLQIAPYKQGLIGWLDGVEPTSISAPATWNPDTSARLERMTPAQAAKRLKFLRREPHGELFLDEASGNEVVVGVAGLPLDQMHEEAKEFVLDHLRQPGEPPLADGSDDSFRRVIEMLEIFRQRRPEAWTGHWLLAKARYAIGRDHEAYVAMNQAFELERSYVVARELAGLCLTLGKFEEAVEAAEAAVATDPGDATLLSNLGVAYLLANRMDEATKSASAAVQAAPDDAVAAGVKQLVEDVVNGKRSRPKSLAELA